MLATNLDLKSQRRVGKSSVRAELSTVARARTMDETRDGRNRDATLLTRGLAGRKPRDTLNLTLLVHSGLLPCFSSLTPPNWKLQGKESIGHI